MFWSRNKKKSYLQTLKLKSCKFIAFCATVKTHPQGAVDDPMHCCPRPKAVERMMGKKMVFRVDRRINSCHREFRIIIMGALPSIIPKSIVESLNRLENDEDNLFSWKLTWSQDSVNDCG